jgi:signal transduction histidine kinase
MIFSVLILIISAPVFYLITDQLYIDETDETLLLHKEEFFEDELPTFTTSDIALWNKYNRNVQIVAPRGIVEDTLFNKIYFDKLENENEPYRELNAPIIIEGKPYTYLGRINQIEKKDMVMGVAIMFLLVIIILLSGILLIVKISSKRLWKPFYKTLGQIHGFEIDKNKPQFASSEIEEFNSLNTSLNRLIEKNTNIYNSQREFVENAAHELQTPLALFQAKIDTLLQLGLSEEQSSIVGALNDDVARLNRLNKNLLLLSKIENQNPEKQPIVLNEYLKKNLDFFTEQAKAKNISIVTELSEKVKIDCNPVLAEILINNLLLNAIRHNHPKGKILIRTEDRALVISNTGQEIALPAEKLFNRFSKSNPSSTGNGLGLAIVKKIVELNHWNISYSFEENLHVFTIKF